LQPQTSAARPKVNHYRPKEHPNAVRVVHEKIGEENWVPTDKGVEIRCYLFICILASAIILPQMKAKPLELRWALS
jgi:hypothetical protein